MERFIKAENLEDFCITNEKYLKNGIKGVKGLAVEFPGFDGNSCLSGNFNNNELNNGFALTLAEADILLVYVFTGPWNWMRDVSVKTTDDIIESVFEKYALPRDIKIVLTGGSMGGLGALMYATNGKFKATACAVSCPVCDLFAVSKFSHFFAASVYFACAHYESDYDTAVKSLSPLYRINDFPKIEYFILWCDKDDVIYPEENAIPLLRKMDEAGLSVETLRLEGKGHCEHTLESMHKMTGFIKSIF